MKTRRQQKRHEEPAHDDVEPTPQTRSSSRRTRSESRKNGQESSSSSTTTNTISNSSMKGKSSTATRGKKRPRTDQPEALPSGFHPALAASIMPPWSSSGQQHPRHQHQVPGSSHPSSKSTSLHNHELVGILEHILATGSVARAASVRHQGLVSYLHHANEHARATAAIAGPLAIQSKEHYDERHRRKTNGGHDTASNGGTARTSEDDETAAAAKAVPAGKAYKSSIGVWPPIDLEGSQAGKEGTNLSSSDFAAAAAAACTTDQFRASLASDDCWELEHGDGLGSSDITLSGGSAGSVAVDEDRAVLTSLLDRCWQRAVHTMSSVVPYDPYGALYDPSSASTTTVAEDVEQDEDALAESSS